MPKNSRQDQPSDQEHRPVYVCVDSPDLPDFCKLVESDWVCELEQWGHGLTWQFGTAILSVINPQEVGDVLKVSKHPFSLRSPNPFVILSGVADREANGHAVEESLP